MPDLLYRFGDTLPRIIETIAIRCLGLYRCELEGVIRRIAPQHKQVTSDPGTLSSGTQPELRQRMVDTENQCPRLPSLKISGSEQEPCQPDHLLLIRLSILLFHQRQKTAAKKPCALVQETFHIDEIDGEIRALRELGAQ
jgi:hypothetical protein